MLPTNWGTNVRLEGETLATGTPDFMPVPVSVTDCGLCCALSAMEMDAVSAPVIEGVKVAEIVQLKPGPRDDPQVFISAKSPLFVPVMVMP